MYIDIFTHGQQPRHMLHDCSMRRDTHVAAVSDAIVVYSQGTPLLLVLRWTAAPPSSTEK